MLQLLESSVQETNCSRHYGFPTLVSFSFAAAALHPALRLGDHALTGTSREDANAVQADIDNRLIIDGEPGSGKTEMLVHAAFQAALDGNQVLIACPVGPLIDVYKDRLPPNENIVVETVLTPTQPSFLP